MSKVDATGLKGELPVSHRDWELALARHFLMVDDSGDATPLNCFAVTPSALAEAAGLEGDDAEHQAVASFRTVLTRGDLRGALEHDWYPTSAASDHAPGYFAYLCLTLFIASRPDDDQRLGGDFHDKLRRFLGVGTGLRSLPGVAAKWRALHTWLERKCAEGLPFRRLVLPAYPPSWVHIGLTRKLAFPAKSDATLLRGFIQSHPGILDRPLSFVTQFKPYLAASNRASDGMRQSFGDFAEARLAGDLFLAEHPFWRLANFCGPSTDRSRGEDVEIVCSFDEDGAPVFIAVRNDGSVITTVSSTLSAAVAATIRAVERSASSSFRGGVVVFQQVGYGRWRSASSLGAAAGPIRLGFSDGAYRKLRDRRALFSTSGDWWFATKPISVAVAEECMSLAGLAGVDHRLAPVSVFGGIRTGTMWLGRPRFLPRVASGASMGSVRPGADADGDLGIDAAMAGAMRLTSTRPVSGSWFVEPAEGRDWSRRLAFSKDAFPHEGPRGGTLGYPKVEEWDGPTEQSKISGIAANWSNARCSLEDLTEAIYAGGKSGWHEGELTALILDAFAARTDAWAVLRVLSEAFVVEPRLRPQWKGRVWTLRPPSLRIAGDVAIVEGSLCKTLVLDFKTVCESLSASPFRRCSRTLAPPVIGCAARLAAEVAERLDWQLHPGAARPSGRLAFAQTGLTLLGREPASRWDWVARRFVADGKEGDGSIALTRWTQPGGRDHDIYTVDDRKDGTQKRLLSRHAATVLAHALARTPLFEARDGLLMGKCPEAHLPDKVAGWLRLRSAENHGMFEGLRVYAVASEDLGWLSRILPSVVSSTSSIRTTGVEAISSARHSNGKIRLAWSGGQLTSVSPGSAVSGGH